MSRARILALIIATIIFLIILTSPAEGFATKREKSQKIYDWFKTHVNPTYTKYKADIDGSNIVEYEDVARLMRDRNLTLDSIEKVI